MRRGVKRGGRERHADRAAVGTTLAVAAAMREYMAYGRQSRREQNGESKPFGKSCHYIITSASGLSTISSPSSSIRIPLTALRTLAWVSVILKRPRVKTKAPTIAASGMT